MIAAEGLVKVTGATGPDRRVLECFRAKRLGGGVELVRATPGEAWNSWSNISKPQVVIGDLCRKLDGGDVVACMIEVFVGSLASVLLLERSSHFPHSGDWALDALPKLIDTE